jgi:hypothetical protein
MNIPSFIESIRGGKVVYLLDAGAGVDLGVFLIPSDLQWHCTCTAVPMVIVILQTT